MVKKNILVVDDSSTIRELLKNILEAEGFEVISVSTGEEALEKIYSFSPDLVILDIRLPGINGYEVCKKIKQDCLFASLPIIMLTSQNSDEDQITGLDMGVDDYVTKPFKPSVLLARINSVIKRTSSDLDCNPLTRLPGNFAIMREINDRLNKELPFAVLMLDIDNFKPFNDYYGFIRGDEVIRTTARIIVETFRQLGNSDDFIGHVGGDDFIMISTPDKAETLCKEIIARFDRQVPEFYDEKDRERGYIVTKDRKGKQQKFSFMSISIGVVTNKYRRFTHFGEISSTLAELKRYLKQQPESNYIIDRRKK